MHLRLVNQLLLAACSALPAAPLFADPPPASPYAGQAARAVKALSDADVAALRDGQGMGLARAAELNGYPGPRHVLELAAALELSPEQARATRALKTEHQQRARGLGVQIIEAEAALDRLFAEGRATADAIGAAAARIGGLQAALRAEHLVTHLRQTQLLTPVQIERYAALRGYRSSAPAVHQH